MKIAWEIKREAGTDPNEVRQLGTFGCFQPLLFDAVADLSLGLAFREVTFNNGRVAFVDLDLLLVVGLEVPQLCKKTHRRGKSQRCRTILSSS